MGYGTSDPDEIRGYFRSLTLPQRMREAARVLKEANGRHFGKFVSDDCAWSVAGLVEVADHFEAEDRAAVERDAMVEELARINADAVYGKAFDELFDTTRSRLRNAARKLIDSGWSRKETQ